MSDIIVFRGKAATGKTLLSNKLSNLSNIPVLRKDIIFDMIAKHTKDNDINNKITYDILSKLIQVNIDNDSDIIVDIGLSGTESWRSFLSKIDLKRSRLISFLCDCSDLAVWKLRFEERFQNPLANQFFKTFEEVQEHYSKYAFPYLRASITLIVQKIYKTYSCTF